MKRILSGILFALLLASIFVAAFSTPSTDAMALLQGPLPVENVEHVASIPWRHTVSSQQGNVARGEMLLKSQVAYMRPAVRDGSFIDLDSPPPANYDEQLGLSFTQTFTSIVYNVTAVQQVDSYGYGPGYLMNGVTDKGYWYQVGLSFDWPYTEGGYAAGFHFNYEVFDDTGKSIYPASGGGGLGSFSGPVNNGDNVLLNLYFSSGNVVMYAYDWSTGASATVTYTAVGGSYFQGQTGTWNAANGFFTGLMTEWYHPNAYYGDEAQAVYKDATFALSSGWLWADEWVPPNGPILFSKGQYTSFPNPTQLQSFSTNGAFEAASGYMFVTGTPALPPTTVFLTPYRIDGTAGQNVTVHANITDVTGLLAYQIGLTWSNTTAVECTNVTGGSILNSIDGHFVETVGAINNTLGKITSPYSWVGSSSQYNINGTGTLAAFTFKMLQTGFADAHVNNMILLYKDGVTIIPCNTVDYFTAVRNGEQYFVRIEGNPVEAHSSYGGFGAESVTDLSPPKLINGTTYQGDMTFDVNGTADDVGSFAYVNATIPNNLMNCTNEDNWIVELDGVTQSGVFISPGTQNTTVSLTFSYSNSSSGELMHTITILSNYVAPSAFSVAISPSSAALDVGESQLFASFVSGGMYPFSYQWYLNSVAVISAINYTWTFNSSSTGSYTIYAKVTDAASVVAASNIATLMVNLPPSVNISPPSATLDVGQSEMLSATTSGGTGSLSYQWYLNDSPISNATSSTWAFSPSSPGSYSAYVRITDEVGVGATSNTANISVNGALSVSVSPSPVVMDFGQSQLLISSVSGGTSPYSYQWFLNGTAVSGSMNSSWTLIPISAGYYNVYVNVTDSVNFTAKSNITNATVNAAPSVTVSPSSFVIDVGQFKTFTATVTGGTYPFSYQWYLNGVSVLDATSSSWNFTPSAAGSNTVYVMVTDNASTPVKAQSNTANATVNPALSVAISSPIATTDAGLTASLSASANGGTEPIRIQWYLNGIAVTGATSLAFMYVPTSSGTFNIYVVATDGVDFNATSLSSEIKVNNRTLITNFNVPPVSSSMLYSNNEVNASVLISGGSSPYTYEWYLNGVNVGNTTSPNYTYVFSKMGRQQMQVKIADSAGYVVESDVLSTNYSYNYVLFILLAVLIAALIGALTFVLYRRASRRAAPKN